MAFTKNDEKTIDKVMRKVMNEVMDEKLDNKLKPLYDFKDEAMCLLKAIRSLLKEEISPDNRHRPYLRFRHLMSQNYITLLKKGGNT